ncbi:MAG: hypothetical protein MUF45_15220 [Spirosomaceae bacterium]|jgi:hypothetical protein|nr:hypothetical protein [Spirosomataceae bacterium]
MDALTQILQRLDRLEANLLSPKNAPVQEEKFLSPKEACLRIGISRTKYEQLKRDGFIKDYSLVSGGRKKFVKLSEIKQLFPKDFATA